MKKTILTGVAAVTLTACGGGGSTTASDAAVGGASGITNQEAITRFSNLNQGFVNVSSDTTLQTQLPQSGTVAYTGNLGFDVRGALPGGGDDVDASLVGDMNISVNFGGTNQPITGSVTNILYADTDGNFDRPSGTLNVVGGVTTLPRNNLPDLEGVVSADINGTLAINQSDGNGDKNVTMDLDLSGQFGGVANATAADNPTAIRGFVIGSGTGDLTLVAPNGRFAVEGPGQSILP